MEGTDSYMASQVKTCPPPLHTLAHACGGVPGPHSPFQPLPLEKAIEIHAVQVLTEGPSPQVVVDRPARGKHRQTFTIPVSSRGTEPCPAG